MRSAEEILKEEYSKLIANPEKVYLQNPSIIKAAHTAINEARKEAIEAAWELAILGNGKAILSLIYKLK